MTKTRAAMSDLRDPIAAPRNREKALSAAFLRHLGSTQEQAAKAAGVDPRTLGRWESCSWWQDVQREAGARWLDGLAARARARLYKAAANDANIALKILERLMPELAPPTIRTRNYDFTPADYTDEGLMRIERGEDPMTVAATGGRRDTGR